MKSSQVAAFADDIKIFKTIVIQEESLVLRADLMNLASWSSPVGLAFNNSKGEVQRAIRKLKPVTASYQLNEHALGSYTSEKEWVLSFLSAWSWDRQVCAVCSKSNKMLGFVRRNTRIIKNVSVRRSIYLTPSVRAFLGYATEVWAP